jgi:CNT family concentrative nucleoside transporter
MATVSSNVLAVYVFSLRDQFPGIGGHLVLASFLSAPAALAAAKLVLPETEQPETLGRAVVPHHEPEENLFAAVIGGANAGVRLVAGIVALLLAVLGMVALANVLLSGAGNGLNTWLGWNVDWSLEGLLGYLFHPVTLLLGVPPEDAAVAARLIGERVVVTELTAYQDLNTALAAGDLQQPRSIVIITYALCGFAHLASLAIFVGGVAALAPRRTVTLTQVGFRALLAATIACLMTACVAGIFYHEGMLQLIPAAP